MSCSGNGRKIVFLAFRWFLDAILSDFSFFVELSLKETQLQVFKKKKKKKKQNFYVFFYSNQTYTYAHSRKHIHTTLVHASIYIHNTHTL